MELLSRLNDTGEEPAAKADVPVACRFRPEFPRTCGTAKPVLAAIAPENDRLLGKSAALNRKAAPAEPEGAWQTPSPTPTRGAGGRTFRRDGSRGRSHAAPLSRRGVH